MKMQRISKHLAVDRIDRAMIIYERMNWDIGEEILCVPHPDSDGRMGLRAITNKGVILCKNIDSKTIVTMWIATPHQVRELYGTTRMPQFISSVVMKNQTRFADII